MIAIAQPIIGKAEKDAVLAVLESGHLVQGPYTEALEERFAALCNTKHAIATSNGTTALHVALLANDIGVGDEVITTPFTFIATVNSILMVGAIPVFVDIDEATFNMNPALIEQAITPKTKAIMPVHLYGQMCDMGAIADIARRHDLLIIEDAAQAVGAAYRGNPAGSYGTGTFSLYATKNVMSVEGGMIVTNDDTVAERSRLLRNHGMRKRYHHEIMGYNYRISDLHAAIGLCQIEQLSEFNHRRQLNAEYFNQRLESVITPTVRPECKHVWHQYTVRLNGGRDRDAAVKQLAEAGVGTGVFYPIPAHRHTYMRGKVGDVCLPVAEKMAAEVFSLPVHPQLSTGDLQRVVTAVNQL
jgi:dTDP-4-amino-4,6-dideoxygalactose transaminase